MRLRALTRPFSRLYDSPLRAPQRLVAQTSDGVRLAIHRVPPPSGRGPALILCHGLSSNHRGLDFPGRSLASWLASYGWDCYLPDLRGCGESERRDLRWDLDHHVFEDVPAILEAVRATSGEREVHWLGHSMGGLILFCHGIAFPEAPIKSAVTVASALDYGIGESAYRKLLPIRGLLEKLPFFPYGTLVHLLSPLLGRIPGGLETFQVHPPNVEPEVIRRLHALCFHTVPTSLLASLASTFDETGFCTRDRSLRYLEAAGRYRIPTRLLAGSADRQISVEAVEHTAGLLGGGSHVTRFGRGHGQIEEYGHWDLLIGRRARDEVWPSILSWLEAHRGAAPVSSLFH